MQISVFGPGCAKCEEARKLVEKVVQENNISASVEKVSDFKEMMSLGIMSTPAVTIDGVVKCTGRVPAASELLAWISGAASGATPDTAKAQGTGGCCCGGKC